MRHTAFALEDTDALEVERLSEGVEQTAPAAKENGHEVDLKLVENSGGKCQLGGRGAVDENVFPPCRLAGLPIVASMSPR